MARTHVMNRLSLRTAMAKVLNIIQNDFPRNTAMQVNGQTTNEELMKAQEPAQFLRLIAKKLAPPKAGKGSTRKPPKPRKDKAA